MPTCTHCQAELDVDELVRHEHHHLLVVHCPNCHCILGSYRDPSL